MEKSYILRRHVMITMGVFLIRSKIGAPDRMYRYRLHKDHMMQPIPLALMQLRPALAGLRSAQEMVEWV